MSGNRTSGATPETPLVLSCEVLVCDAAMAPLCNHLKQGQCVKQNPCAPGHAGARMVAVDEQGSSQERGHPSISTAAGSLHTSVGHSIILPAAWSVAIKKHRR